MTDNFIYVAVPSALAPKVYALLAELTNDPVVEGSGAYGGGTSSEPELLRRMYEESLGNHQELMEFLANAPGRWFYTGDLATQLGLEHGARGLAGMLGAFGRRSKNRYGGATPWESEWDGAREEARHRMPEETAGIIREVAQRHREREQG